MKKLLALILALAMILTLSACGGEPTDTNPTDDPTGSVGGSNDPTGTTAAPTDPAPKTETKWVVQTETYVYEDPSLGTVTAVYTYDDLGNLLTCRQESATETLEMVMTYDENGHEESITITRGDQVMKQLITCDENGNRIKTEAYDNDVLFQTYTYTYDENGNQLTMTVVTDMYSMYTEYTYDESGNVLGYKSYYNKELQSTVTVEYDDQGRHIRSTTTDAQGDIGSITEATYEGNTETRITKAADGTVLTTMVFTRDEHGNAIAIENSGTHTMPYSYTATYISIEVPVSE